MLPSQRLRELGVGRWVSILKQLGIPEKCLTGLHTACPICGGKDRFRFDNIEGRGTYFCSHCGAGDGFALACMHMRGGFMRTVRAIERTLPGSEFCAPEKDKDRSDPASKAKWIKTTWARSQPLRDSRAAVSWWTRRVGFVPDCDDLRVTTMRDTDGGDVWNCMVALVRNRDGNPVALHRTFVTLDGYKAPIATPRRTFGSMPGGAAVRLHPVEGDTLGIGEGLETCEAARHMFQVPVWSALDADHVAGWRPPETVKKVIVFGDNDKSFTGQAVAYSLARKLVHEAKVAKRELDVEVKIPGVVGDWNDILYRHM